MLRAMSADEASRAYEIVVYGATGFTGQLVAQYLAENAPRDLRWAIAGRNRGKLEEVRRATNRPDLPIILVASDDEAGLLAMCRSTRVVLTTVGPYAEHGEPVVRNAIDGGADYVDITGEPAFVDMTLARYADRAKAAGVRVVSCCGFDSIPHDLGAYFAVRALSKRVTNEPIKLEGFVRSRGTFSGGTWQSAIGAFSSGRAALKSRAPKEAATGARNVRGVTPSIHYESRIEAYAVPLPTIDPQVVLRSARRLDVYGPDFRYGHYAHIKNLSTIVGGAVGIGAIVALSQVPITRDLLLKVRGSGEGPSPAERARSWFEVTMLGRAQGGAEVRAIVRGKDPGYDETAKMISEAALCLARDRESLPDARGVLTTAVAMGDALITRLQRAGISFDIA
jgi:short subunit dehydrogenase-like uncharacterized protein